MGVRKEDVLKNKGQEAWKEYLEKSKRSIMLSRMGVKPTDENKDRWVVEIDYDAPSIDGIPKKEVVEYLRKKTFDISKTLQRTVAIDWHKKYGNNNIIIVDAGAIKKRKSLKYRFELYQLHLTDEPISEFEELCAKKLDDV